jgi:hypothetical protein
MPNTRRSSKQVAKDKAALKRLQKSGTYSGKVDLRKKPTPYQLKKIKALADARKKSGKKPEPGPTVKKSRISDAKLKALKEPKHKLTTYALPFLRRGQSDPEWRRFTYKGLRAFLAEYKGGDPEGAAEWQSYAVREEWTFPPTTPAEIKEIKTQANLYFTGTRIDEPKGGIRQRRKPNAKAHRGRRK